MSWTTKNNKTDNREHYPLPVYWMKDPMLMQKKV